MSKPNVEQQLEAQYCHTKVSPTQELRPGEYGLRVIGNPRGKQIYMVQHEDTLIRRATEMEVFAWCDVLQHKMKFDTLLQRHQVTSRYVTE